MLNTKTSINKHLSNMFTKAQKLKQLIDKVVFDRNKFVDFTKYKNDELYCQNTEIWNYEESAIKPIISFYFLRKLCQSYSPDQILHSLATSLWLNLSTRRMWYFFYVILLYRIRENDALNPSCSNALSWPVPLVVCICPVSDQICSGSVIIDPISFYLTKKVIFNNMLKMKYYRIYELRLRYATLYQVVAYFYI